MAFFNSTLSKIDVGMSVKDTSNIEFVDEKFLMEFKCEMDRIEKIPWPTHTILCLFKDFSKPQLLSEERSIV